MKSKTLIAFATAALFLMPAGGCLSAARPASKWAYGTYTERADPKGARYEWDAKGGFPKLTNSLAIHLFSEPVDRRLTMRGQGDWSRLRLSPSPLISDADIVSYDFANHAIRLRPDALARVPRPPVEGTPFVLVADDRPVYLGVFTTSASSMSFAVPAITVDRRALVTNQPPDTLVIERAYPQPSFGVGPDPRSDPRIKTALAALHLLKGRE